MSRRANPTAIGGFVLGALALVVVALAVFGSGKFFTRHSRAVMFFQGNIQGLNIGSQVNLRGVEIGTVTDVQLRLDVKKMQPLIPVYIEFDPSRFKTAEGSFSAAEIASQEPLKLAIAHGLHAKLATMSLVTGQLAVELDLNPNEPRRLVGADPSTIEIPTSQSDIEKLKTALSKLPLDELASSALKLLNDSDRLVTSKELPRMLSSLAGASENLDQMINAIRGDLPALLADMRETTKSGRQTLASAQTAMTDLRTALNSANRLLTTDAPGAVKAAVIALEQAQKVLADADSLVAANSPQRFDLDQSLRNLSATTRSLRVFADDLERRPNSVIMGK